MCALAPRIYNEKSRKNKYKKVLLSTFFPYMTPIMIKLRNTCSVEINHLTYALAPSIMRKVEKIGTYKKVMLDYFFAKYGPSGMGGKWELGMTMIRKE